MIKALLKTKCGSKQHRILTWPAPEVHIVLKDFEQHGSLFIADTGCPPKVGVRVFKYDGRKGNMHHYYELEDRY